MVQEIKPKEKALVCLSGGQDSTYALAWAKRKFKHVEAVFFNYGQKHLTEEHNASTTVAKVAGVVLHEIEVPLYMKNYIHSALTNKEIDPSDKHPLFGHLPASFTPLRNVVLFSQAAALAIDLGIMNLVVGVSQIDYSGYPDCRDYVLGLLERVINLALDLKPETFRIHAPCTYISKAQEVRDAIEYMPELLEWWKHTHTCYNGQFPPCGKCPACKLRQKAFEEAGIEDPLFARVGVKD